MSGEKESCYAVVGNIPSKLHSVDLRSFFSQFIEGGKFQCFHFRHRPEVLKRKDEREISCHEIPLANNTQEEPLTLKGKTTCCVVRLKEEHVKELLKVYNGENWIDKDGKLFSQKVIISTVTVYKDLQASKVAANYQTRKEKREHKKDRVEFVKEDLLKLSEFRPPSFMPNGNIGTSLNVFLDLIRTCQLPPHVIKKLGLSFPSGRSKHRYGNVPFDYGKDAGSVSLCVDNVSGSAELKNNGKMQGSCVEHFECSLEEDERKNQDFSDCNNSGVNDDIQEEKLCKDGRTCEGSELTEDSDSEPEEDWERHEALYDDVDCQARTKERLYENKIELKWEKGGSGLVFYTDAAYWDSLNGDFDEQTADDWDIDMGLYEKGGTGDRNSKALLEIRIGEQRRAGNDVDDDETTRKIGEFEKHTKGFGGTLMRRQGWAEGSCLGASQPGITEPIPTAGQNPHCKRGFGYYGEKLERHVKRKRVDRDVVISTVFDTRNEKHSTPFQSAGPFTLKYCNKVEFVPQKTKTAKL